MRTPMWIACALTLCMLTGCSRKEDPKAEPTPSRQLPTATSAANVGDTPGKSAWTDDDVPVPEDFIENATKEVNKDNATAELDKLDKEIATGK